MSRTWKKEIKMGEIIIKKKYIKEKKSDKKKKKRAKKTFQKVLFFLVGCMGGLYFQKEEFIEE